MRSITFPRLVALVATVALLAACGGGDDSGDSDASPEAQTTAASGATVAATEVASADADRGEVCALLTDDEVTELLGSSATTVEQSVSGPFVACQWANETLPIQLLQIGTYDFDVDSEFFRETAGSFATELEEVPGLGDEAVWTGDQLFIRQGELMISIIQSNGGGRDQAVAAAELAVPRLN
ncbi:MAG: DUF3558 family protein [Chloroflexi bacterium]|nr:DUF3558 family protein [Chloroflexota bacterium]MDA1147252.1 DUF3558 family protein [Chloroflexota bacterium]